MEGLGINGQLFIAQLINFGILFFLLVWLLKGPITRILQERTDKIEASLKEAAEIKTQLAKIDSTKAELIAAAKKEAEAAVEKGQALASSIQKNSTEEAKSQAEQIVARAKEEVTNQKEQLMGQLEGEIKTLVKEAIASSVSDLTPEEQKRLVDASINNLKKSKRSSRG